MKIRDIGALVVVRYKAKQYGGADGDIPIYQTRDWIGTVIEKLEDDCYKVLRQDDLAVFVVQFSYRRKRVVLYTNKIKLGTRPLTPFSHIKFPQIRRVMPSLIAQQRVSVQPMTAPTGAIFYHGFQKKK